MCIHKYRTLARFGLTHMVATNVCIWFRTVAKETIRDVERFMLDHDISIYGMHRVIVPQKNTTFTTSTLPTYTTLPSPTFKYDPEGRESEGKIQSQLHGILKIQFVLEVSP